MNCGVCEPAERVRVSRRIGFAAADTEQGYDPVEAREREVTMAVLAKTVLTAFAGTAVALSMSACGGSTSSTASSATSAMSSASSAASSVASSASSAASSAVSSATSAVAAPAEGTLASVCTEIDAVMMGNPDADPAGTAQQLEAIKAKITTPDAELVENVAAAYSAIAADPSDVAAQDTLSTSASALGAGCQSATGTPGPN